MNGKVLQDLYCMLVMEFYIWERKGLAGYRNGWHCLTKAISRHGFHCDKFCDMSCRCYTPSSMQLSILPPNSDALVRHTWHSQQSHITSQTGASQTAQVDMMTLETLNQSGGPMLIAVTFMKPKSQRQTPGHLVGPGS